MEIMRLTTDNRIYNIFSDNINAENPKIYGYIYEDNHFYPLNEDVFEELNKLKIGNNTKKIGDYESDNLTFDVILDLDTNLKHYFLNGKEDYSLFINNFEDVIISDNKSIKYIDNLADKHKKQDSKIKVLTFANNIKISITAGILIGSLIANLGIDYYQSHYISNLMENTPELTPEIISEIITNNDNISDEDKKILLNYNLLDFICPYINENKEYAAKLYNIILPRLNIVDKRLGKRSLGSYDRFSKTIKIDSQNIANYSLDVNGKNLEEIDLVQEHYNDVLLHEWCHVLQPTSEHKFLRESCTEILSNEFESISFITYTEEQKRIKILMEIIGFEPVIEYNFTGNIETFRKSLEPYLSADEIDQLLELFKDSNQSIPDTLTKEQFAEKLRNIDTLLCQLYYNKYQQSFETNYVINRYLDDENENLQKYYFYNSYRENYNYYFDLNNYKLEKNRGYIDSHYTQTMLKPLCDNLNFEIIKYSFVNNPNLNNDEKDILFNEDFINDYIKYKSEYYEELMTESGNVPIYNNIGDINDYLYKLKITRNSGEMMEIESSDSFPYMISENDLFQREIVINESNCYQYSYINNLLYGDVYQKELIEQFVRAFSTSKECNYNNILNSACTNMILKEYYGIELPKKDSISMFEEKVTKILMDLIGNEPLKYYYFTGDNKLIKEKLGQISDTDVNEIMKVLEQRITNYFNNDFKVYQDLDMCLCNLYNNKNNTQYPYSNFVNNYYIPETKGYFSKSYIEKDKLEHPENYGNISFEENNDLGKSR